MKQVAILNVTGYAGAELARLLHGHPDVRLAGVTGRSAAGKRLTDVFPHLRAMDMPIDGAPPDGIDLLFSALPHAAAAEHLVPYIDRGVPVVDLSADFRLQDVAAYEGAYNVTHPAPALLRRAVFGLPELRRQALTETSLAAVPGCHSTGVVLALAPLFAAGIIEPRVIADTKTGLSGAGRTLGLSVHFSEADESVAAYGLDGHRHRPEMTQELAFAAAQGGHEGCDPQVTFVPHYIPMTRGILSTCYATFRPGASIDRTSLLALYRAFYADAPFTHVTDAAPATKHTAGTNDCLVHPSIDLLTGQIVVTSALDNLGKGAAGAAVQCMNLMLGLPETAGLQALAQFP